MFEGALGQKEFLPDGVCGEVRDGPVVIGRKSGPQPKFVKAPHDRDNFGGCRFDAGRSYVLCVVDITERHRRDQLQYDFLFAQPEILALVQLVH